MHLRLTQTNSELAPGIAEHAGYAAPAWAPGGRTMPGRPSGRRLPTAQRDMVMASLLVRPDVAGRGGAR